MLKQRTVCCSHLEVHLVRVVSSTEAWKMWKMENCLPIQQWQAISPASFWRCLALSSDLNIMQKSLTGSTASLFTDCNGIWRDFACMEGTCFFLMWLGVQSMRIGKSGGASKQNCCRHITIAQASDKIIIRGNSVTYQHLCFSLGISLLPVTGTNQTTECRMNDKFEPSEI